VLHFYPTCFVDVHLPILSYEGTALRLQAQIVFFTLARVQRLERQFLVEVLIVPGRFLVDSSKARK